MLIFVEMLFLFYIFVNFIVVSVESNHENIYEAFDWYDEPGKAFGDMLLCMIGLALEDKFSKFILHSDFILDMGRWKGQKYNCWFESADTR